MKRRYLDHNATTPLGEAARAAIAPLLQAADGAALGNPSSLHASGRAARHVVEEARGHVAKLVGAHPLEVTFTGSGSEAIALGAVGLAKRARERDAARTRVLVGASEHPAVLGACDVLASLGFVVERLAVGPSGRVMEASALEQIDMRVAIALLQLANHETGVLQPVAALASVAHARGAFVLCDAVQAAGKVPIDRAALDVDALCVSAHKLYAPKGVGALILREGLDVDPLVPGGHQERGRRPGTEAVWAIAGFGAAAAESKAHGEAESVRQASLRAQLEAGLESLGAIVFGKESARVPNTTMFAFPGANGQLVAIALDLAGFEVSTGAACSSGSLKPSAVLLASGHDVKLAQCAIRISLGRGNDAADIAALLAALPPIVERVREA